ncbi:MAG: DNA-directed RNA polymerase subunit beta, partial [Candidatus Dependentiae bacterium]
MSINNALVRKSFGKIKQVVKMPDLIEVQSKSFNDFIQFDYLPSERKYMGLEKVLKDIFPIEYNDRIALEYVSYELGEWSCVCGALAGLENRYRYFDPQTKKEGVGRIDKNDTTGRRYSLCKKCSSRVNIKVPYTVDECRYSGKTYSLPLKIRMQLTAWEVNEETGDRIIRDIKEQEVFFCDLPVMVDLHENADGEVRLGNQGTFLINGVDRVCVSQIHRAPGVVFSLSKKLKDFRGHAYHLARLIPSRGSWLDFEFDHNDILYVRIDKKKKILATTFLQAIGVKRDDILPLFYQCDDLSIKGGAFVRPVNEGLLGQRIENGAVPEKFEKKYRVGKRITQEVLDDMAKDKIRELAVRDAGLVSRVVGYDVVDEATGELLLEQGATLTTESLEKVRLASIKRFPLVRSAGYIVPPFMALTLAQDKTTSYEDALREVYYKLRPGDIPTTQIMEEYIHNMFFNPRFYDMTLVGRIRTNRKLGLTIDEGTTHLTQEDVVATIKYLVGLRERGEGEMDDIDHLGNRCVRLVGELMENQLYSGFARIEKIVRERFRLQENAASLMPYDFLNVKPLAAVMREFFGTGQLSQFMDQTNPLAEMAHKRRISALGPGGVTRERATFEVRDVHASHYGRICPIETPEGQNVGLISSLSTYARVNELGFIETTYRPVVDGKVADEVKFLDAFEERGKCVAQATTPTDPKGKFSQSDVMIRQDGDYRTVDKDSVDYVDASPRQMVSVATALIPFLEHDDANRALMGSNMQRQAVPLIRCQAPLVGTGMEREIGGSEGSVVTARNGGVVEYVSADKIVVRLDESGSDERWFAKPVDIYILKKFGRSSHNTWIHHKPMVKVGQRVEHGDVLTDGPATDSAELALGSNVLVAFMPWHGYNFEDAIVVSKRLKSDDVFTSVHIEEFVVEARDTKLGAEEITKDIPNVSEKELEALDDDGIVYVGSRVKPGDILVGKVTLKGDVQVSPEEKLLRAIFGEKSREVRDTSLRMPPSVHGTVVDVKVFSRSGIRKDKR